MKTTILLLGFFICTLPAVSQNLLTGKVVDKENNKPLSAVSIYLNNTSIGVVSNAQGQFILHNIPKGKFRLVASSVGFKTYSRLITGKDLSAELLITLEPEVENLKGMEVLPTDPNGWVKWGKLFIKIFIGTTSNAFACELQNPEVLKFRQNPDNTLSVFAGLPLKISNEYLGYDISYSLEEFEFDFNSKVVIYNGYALFKDKSIAHPAKALKWQARRAETYNGSLMHFMRAFFTNTLAGDGFEMRSLATISNPKKDRAKMLFKIHPDSVLLDTIVITPPPIITGPMLDPEQFMKRYITKDSGAYYKNALLEPDSVISHQLQPADSLGFAVDSSTAGFYFPDSLEVGYLLKTVPTAYQHLSRKKETHPVSQFVFVNKKPVNILSNGFYYGPHDLKITGFWAWWETMSTMLPYDYYPKKNN